MLKTRMVLKTLKIGTRGSPLALIQAKMVEDALQAVHAGLQVETVVIRTSGDWKPEQGEMRLSEAQGGKGLFAREIEDALLNRTIDCAVHSMKDMPSFLPEGLALDHTLERADARDAFISYQYKSIEDLPKGAVVGTSSVRRQAFLLKQRPDIYIVPLRGNVHTRLLKIKEGQADATFLAMAGLERIALAQEDFVHPLAVLAMIPACAQGIIAIETRAGDEPVRSLLDPIHHEETGLSAAAERAALQILDGSCHTPIGAYARMENGKMLFDLAVAALDGRNVFSMHESATIKTVEEARTLGKNVATALKDKLPAGFLS